MIRFQRAHRVQAHKEILAYRYRPRGLVYELENDKPGKWLVNARRLQLLAGVTNWLRVIFMTGEVADPSV